LLSIAGSPGAMLKIEIQLKINTGTSYRRLDFKRQCFAL